MMESIIRITFEDNGQDFTHWDVHPETGKVLDCQPFQYDLWCNGKRHVGLPQLGLGLMPTIYDEEPGANAPCWRLMHRVGKIETVPADWLHLKNAGLPYEKPAA